MSEREKEIVTSMNGWHHMPDPTPEMLASPAFEAIWQCIKTWDIAVPAAYGGYCSSTGSHVRAILDALAASRTILSALTPATSRESETIAFGYVTGGDQIAEVVTEKEVGSTPEGWKLVPVEPTPAMLRAAFLTDEGFTGPVDDTTIVELFAQDYRAMLSLSPEPPRGEKMGNDDKGTQASSTCATDAAAQSTQREKSVLIGDWLERQADADGQIKVDGVRYDGLREGINLAFDWFADCSGPQLRTESSRRGSTTCKTAAEDALNADSLYQLLLSGNADSEAQMHAAQWIKWLCQFVPDKQYKLRRDGY